MKTVTATQNKGGSVSKSRSFTRSSKHMDMNQLAKRILDEATGEVPKTKPPQEKNPAAVELGKLSGKKGGAARAAKLTPKQRSEIAKKAAVARWKN